MGQKITIIIFAALFYLLIAGRWSFYAVQGYYVVTRFEHAHQLANKIISNGLNEDKCFDIKYLKGRILPDYLDDQTMQDTCIEDVAKSRKDPMICAKMSSHYTASSCGSDIYGYIFTDMKYDAQLAVYSCYLADNESMVECWYDEYPPAPAKPYRKTEKYPLDQCNKFKHERSQEWCKTFHVKTIDDCDTFKIRYFKEICYFSLDLTCSKSSEPLLQKGCEMKKVINERFKDDTNRRNGNYW